MLHRIYSHPGARSYFLRDNAQSRLLLSSFYWCVTITYYLRGSIRWSLVTLLLCPNTASWLQFAPAASADQLRRHSYLSISWSNAMIRSYSCHAPVQHLRKIRPMLNRPPGISHAPVQHLRKIRPMLNQSPGTSHEPAQHLREIRPMLDLLTRACNAPDHLLVANQTDSKQEI